MKLLFTFLLFGFSFGKVVCQQISPAADDLVCPKLPVFIVATVPGNAVPPFSLNATTNHIPDYPSASSGITYYAFDASKNRTEVHFSAIFADQACTQGFQIGYSLQSDVTPMTHIFSIAWGKIASFLPSYPSKQTPVPNVSSIIAQRCQNTNFSISVAPVYFYNNNESPQLKYGPAVKYQYALPQGWSIGTQVSNGSNWIQGGNAVTITSDQIHGDGGNIAIEALTSCAGSVSNSPPAYISISRPTPIITITTSNNSNLLCGGSVTAGVNGAPANSTFSWSIDNTSAATIPANSSGQTVVVTKGTVDGKANLKLVVTACGTVYNVTKVLLFGKPGANVISTYTNMTDCQYHNLAINGTFPGSSGILVISDANQVATSYSWSRTAGSGPDMSVVDNGGGSVTVTSKRSPEVVNLTSRASNTCGFSTQSWAIVAGPCSFIQSAGNQLQTGTSSDESDTASSMHDFKEARIFPNPARNQAHVYIPNHIKSGQIAIRVIDFYGQTVSAYRFNPLTNIISTSNLRPGVYLVQIYVGDKKVATRKLLIN